MSKTFRAADPHVKFNVYESWKENRDKKRKCKPGKIFKKFNRKSEKLKIKNALKHDEDPPLFKKHDAHDWNLN